MELIGHCAVDSGQILLVDPCYINSAEWVEHWTGGYDIEAEPRGYGQCCIATLSEDGYGEVTVSGSAGNGVAVRTSYGDGNYPVYRDGDKVIIDFG